MPQSERDWYFHISTPGLSLAHGNVRNLTTAADLVRTHVTNLPPSLIPADEDITIVIQPQAWRVQDDRKE